MNSRLPGRNQHIGELHFRFLFPDGNLFESVRRLFAMLAFASSLASVTPQSGDAHPVKIHFSKSEKAADIR